MNGRTVSTSRIRIIVQHVIKKVASGAPQKEDHCILWVSLRTSTFRAVRGVRNSQIGFLIAEVFKRCCQTEDDKSAHNHSRVARRHAAKERVEKEKEEDSSQQFKANCAGGEGERESVRKRY